MGVYPPRAVDRAMKAQEVILRAMSGQIKWFQAAEIIGVSPRTMRRWRRRYEEYGYDGLFENSEGGVLMAPRYRVTLTAEERAELKALTRAVTKTTGKRFLYARALLLCDRGPEGPGWTVARVAEALGISARTLERLKRRFVEQGLEFALERKRRVRPPRKVIFDGVFEARLVALACSPAPPGRQRWTLRLLAEKVVELGWVERGLGDDGAAGR